MNKPIAVILLSGGLDSCVCLAEAAREFEPAALHLNYGQRTEARELRAFNEICGHYGVKHRLAADVSHLNQIGGTSLIDTGMAVETGLPDTAAEAVPSTYVPFRNANILAVGVSWAEVLGARAVFLGVVEEDSSGYPDCNEKFIRAFSAAIDAGTKPETRIELRTPLIHLDKAAIVRRGMELAAPLHLTWSCYVDEERACGECESCRLRLRGFEQAGVADPVPYQE